MSKDILKNSLVYTILGFLPLSFAFFFTPIYLNYMNAEDYGVLNLFNLYAGIFAQIMGLGVGRAFLYFYWDVYSKKAELKSLISSTLGLLLILQIFFIGFGLLFGNEILKFIIKADEKYTYNPIFIITIFQAAITIFHEMFGYFYRNEEKLTEYSVLNVGALLILTAATLIGVVFLDLKAEGAVFGRFIGYGSVTVLFLIIMIKKYGVKIDLKQSKLLLAFSLPIFFNAFVGSLSYGSDKILIERLDTMKNLGIYGFALVFIGILEIWLNAINNALSPSLYRYLNEDIDKKTKEVKGLSYIIISSVFLLIVVILALLYPVLELLFPLDYHQVTTYVPILATAFLWKVFTSLKNYSLFITKKTKLFVYNETTILLSTLLFGYCGYYLMGIIGIVVAIYLVRVVEFFIMSYFSNKVMKLPIPLTRFYWLAIIISFSSFLCSYFDKNDIIPSYLLFLLPLLTLLVTYPILMKKELLLIIFSIKNRKRLFA